MVIKEASFLVSNTDYQKCPDPGLPEYAFIGRSNVGKSSLINRLAARSNLAKTSSTPGKTQLINHFIINKSWYLVDLPGYGYAKIGKHEREKWERMIYDYLRNRPNLVCTFVLVDSRHEMQKADLEFMMNLTELGVPFNLVFTKVDKLRPNQVNPTIERYLQQMKEYWEELPRYFVTSSEKSIGREDLLLAIEEYNQIFNQSRGNIVV
ncbi:MAG: ribosome biogenesis GTP-binding protein YihA/YsxC [Spirosomataceae bacterium]